MNSFRILLIYQNQLFAEGLESIFNANYFVVFKKEISEISDIETDKMNESDVLIFEVNWPFPQLEKAIEKLYLLAGGKMKFVLITNVIKKNVLKLVSGNKIQGIILKSSGKEELLFGITRLLEGQVYYSSKVTTLLLNNNKEKEITISKREKQVLSLMAEMKSTEKIATLLSISKSTVKTHRRNLMRKFDLKNVLCLFRFACRENLLDGKNDFCDLCYKNFTGA